MNMTKFQLFNLREDERETTDLSAKHPDKFAEMKAALLKMDAEIMAEGPDWWKRDTADQPRAKKAE